MPGLQQQLVHSIEYPIPNDQVRCLGDRGAWVIPESVRGDLLQQLCGGAAPEVLHHDLSAVLSDLGMNRFVRAAVDALRSTYYSGPSVRISRIGP